MIKTEVELRQKLSRFRGKRYWLRRMSTRAAVTAVVVNRPRTDTYEGGLSLLFMKRATREGDPWSGDMSFPGGRTDATDRNNFATGVRELKEETGLDILAEGGEVIGRLSDVRARGLRWGGRPFVVTPFVFWLDNEPTEWHIEPAEVDTLVWIPISFFADPANRGVMTWHRRKNIPVEYPCYDYGPYRVWGLTLRMVDELIQLLTI